MKYLILSSIFFLVIGCSTTNNKVELWYSFIHTQNNSNFSQKNTIAKRYAPIIFQEVDRGTKTFNRGTQTFKSKARGKEDFITAVNFDGDLIGNNNWENQSNSEYKLIPEIYYSIVETKSHYFISYSIFHPRDWTRNLFSIPIYVEHENDMENIQVVVSKNTQKEVRLLLTQAHLNSTFYSLANSEFTPKDARVKFSSKPIVLFNDKYEIDSNGTHVGIFVERKGHGIYSLGDTSKIKYTYKNNKIDFIEKKRDYIPFYWESFPIIQYVPTNKLPREPTIKLFSGMDQKFEYEVPYKIVSVYQFFWQKIEDGGLVGRGELFDTFFKYEDNYFDLKKIPRHFDSDKISGPIKRDAGISPFTLGLNLSHETGDLGVFFFNPAYGYKKYFNISGTWSTVYTYNPYHKSKLNMKYTTKNSSTN
jgi:hypothetical protein